MRLSGARDGQALGAKVQGGEAARVHQGPAAQAERRQELALPGGGQPRVAARAGARRPRGGAQLGEHLPRHAAQGHVRPREGRRRERSQRRGGGGKM